MTSWNLRPEWLHISYRLRASASTCASTSQARAGGGPAGRSRSSSTWTRSSAPSLIPSAKTAGGTRKRSISISSRPGPQRRMAWRRSGSTIPAAHRARTRIPGRRRTKQGPTRATRAQSGRTKMMAVLPWVLPPPGVCPPRLCVEASVRLLTVTLDLWKTPQYQVVRVL